MAPSATTVTQLPTTVTHLPSPAKQVTRDYGGDTSFDGRVAPAALVGQALKQRVESIDFESCTAGEEDAFFVADLGEVYRQHLRWKMNLKRVRPFYAVKCNPDAQVLRLLAELGTGFDCASKQEIQQVLDMGVDAGRIIYANPCKTNSYVRYAAKQQVKQMTFDNAEELHKVKQCFPEAELFLRISTDDESSVCRLSLKFGAALDSVPALLDLAKELGLNVVGVSFHVGSGATDPQVYLKAVLDARQVLDQGKARGLDMGTLDVGGGFCSDTFESMARVLSQALDDYIPSQMRIIGEPGRYYVARAFTLACNVIARRTIQDPATAIMSYMVYLNDGMYGNFSCIMFDHQHPIPRILRCGNRFRHDDPGSGADDGSRTQYSIWGPSCDGIDCIAPRCELDDVLDVGDWLYFDEMGGTCHSTRDDDRMRLADGGTAYTKCSTTRFNGFTDNHNVVYVCSEPGASALLALH